MNLAFNETSTHSQLQKMAISAKQTSIAQHMKEDRSGVWTIDACEIHLDFSKNLLSSEVIRLLRNQLLACNFDARRSHLFSGKAINSTEKRAVMHMALRAFQDDGFKVDGNQVHSQVESVLREMTLFSEQLRNGHLRGSSGKRIKNVVNIGIGGSDLGPQMAFEALKFYSDRNLAIRFVSNVDGSDFMECVRDLDPGETIFLVVSKTFTTQETMANAKLAKEWITQNLAGGQKAVSNHFAAVSTNLTLTKKFGIDDKQVFAFWDWVGGRYSLSSAVGLSLMIAIGPKLYREMLEGMRAMDRHFFDADLSTNLPVTMGLLSHWYVNYLGVSSIAVLPYDNYLKRFPSYLQQLIMESNGKQVSLNGSRINYASSPVYWGEVGTNSQHSFFQMLHQGTQIIPVDFIACLESLSPHQDHHRMLLANVFAQAEALAYGKSKEQVALEGVSEDLLWHKVFAGNRPSNLLLLKKLTPKTLGSLVALYEHMVFVQGVLWNINPYDQWGVELGKVLASEILAEMNSGKVDAERHDKFTADLIRQVLG